MGFGFVILFHLVVIFVVSVIISLIWTILTRLLSKKENRKRKVLFASIAPFIGLYSIYILGLIGCIIVSESKDVDLGIGDCWYVPLNNKCKLTFIDLPEQASLDEGSRVIVDNINLIQQTNSTIICKTYDSSFSVYQTNSSNVTKYENEIDFKKSNPEINLNLKKAWDFYIDRKDEIAGTSFKIVGLIALTISCLMLWIIRKLILGLFQFQKRKKLLPT